MTQDEKIILLAKAILGLAKMAATEEDYDGEQTIFTGVILPDNLEWKLLEIIEGK